MRNDAFKISSFEIDKNALAFEILEFISTHVVKDVTTIVEIS